MKASASAMAEQIGEALPYLRRYARALTGSQASGDTYAAATLEAILDNSAVIDPGVDTKSALFRAFHKIWVSSGGQVDANETGLLATVQDRLENLTRGAREALLLHTIEEMPLHTIAYVMEVSEEEAAHLVSVARQEMADGNVGRVLIIEDEAIIAMDLEAIVTDIGHEVVGIARTADRAVELGRSTKPDLVLADIHLADNSSGIDAATTLMSDLGDLPVIFITAYPERLLTGERPEPAFLISKPYQGGQVRSAIAQALFFASTETLEA